MWHIHINRNNKVALRLSPQLVHPKTGLCTARTTVQPVDTVTCNQTVAASYREIGKPITGVTTPEIVRKQPEFCFAVVAIILAIVPTTAVKVGLLPT